LKNAKDRGISFVTVYRELEIPKRPFQDAQRIKAKEDPMKGKSWFFVPVFLLVLALLFGSAFAQVTRPKPPNPGGGSTTPGNPGGSATPGAGAPVEDIDLPITKLARQGEDDDDDDDDDDIIIYDEEIPTEDDNVIYVIDISGSMRGGRASYIDPDGNQRTGTKLDRAKAELIKSINGLSDNFTFNCFAFTCSIRSFSSKRLPATARNKQAAASWTMALRATGATGTGPAVATALRDRDNKTLILISDGAPNCIGSSWGDRSQHLAMILSNNTQKAKISCFGIGAYGGWRQFLVDIASKTGGVYRDV
jgi:hypothetical protein